MAPIDKAVISQVLADGPFRSLEVGKELTLAFAGLYLASTTLRARPRLVWDLEKTYYPRYHVPIETLHPDVRSRLTETTAAGTGNPTSQARLEVLDTLKGPDGTPGAVIEALTIGSRSTAWVRYLTGPLKDYVRFERDEIDNWFENGAIFAGLRNPYKRIETTPVAHSIVVKAHGEVVAESNVAVLLNETYLKPVYYLPATSIKNWDHVTKSDRRSQCPYKGEAWYFDLNVHGKKYDNAIWYYMYPTHESAGIGGFISFYLTDGIEMTVDGIDVSELKG